MLEVQSSNIGMLAISKIEQLNLHEIDFRSLSSNPVIRKIILDSKEAIVTANNNILVTSNNLKSNAFRQCRAILKSSDEKYLTCVLADDVYNYVCSEIDHVENDHEKSNLTERPKAELKIVGKTAAEQLLESIVLAAHKVGSSDIKIIIRPAERRSNVFFKIDGAYRPQEEYSNKSRDQLINMIRSAVNYTIKAAGGDSFDDLREDVPTDHQIPLTINGQRIQIRTGILPAESNTLAISLRLTDSKLTEGKLPTLFQLGFLEEQVALIRDAMKLPFGLILFTGPTGSGKTTAIASSLCIPDDNLPIITFEDPVEIPIHRDCLVQCPIDTDNEFKNWTAMLRQGLRQDPDILMVGEIRDSEVAEIASRGAGTGHLVLSTLHVNGVIDIPSALTHYKLPLHKVAEEYFLRLGVATRLIKGNCENCAVPFEKYEVNDRDTYRIKNHFNEYSEKIRFHNSDGCAKCNFTGYSGRVLIAEVVWFDSTCRQFISNNDSKGLYTHLKKMGWIDMKAHAEIVVKNGKVCPFEAERNIPSPFGRDDLNQAFDYSKYRMTLRN